VQGGATELLARHAQLLTAKRLTAKRLTAKRLTAKRLTAACVRSAVPDNPRASRGFAVAPCAPPIFPLASTTHAEGDLRTSEQTIMSKVFISIGLSLDGYMAPDWMTMENPGYKNWGAKWGTTMSWILNQQYFRENLQLGAGGETGPVNDLVRSTTERSGADIMGKRMFDQGEIA
jgi:hypothetical protein